MLPGEFFGGLLFGGLGGALLRQLEVDAAKQNAWGWWSRAQQLEQHIANLSRALFSKDLELVHKDTIIRFQATQMQTKDAEIQRPYSE